MPAKKVISDRGYIAVHDRDRGEYLVQKKNGPGFIAVVGDAAEFHKLVTQLKKGTSRKAEVYRSVRASNVPLSSIYH